MQAVVDSKQKIIDAQVPSGSYCEGVRLPLWQVTLKEGCTSGLAAGEAHRQFGCCQHSADDGADPAEGALRCDIPKERPVA